MPEAINETLNVRCAIAGGGPAGMMLGFLLARAGVEVAVLEKHADFLRDFRGDTIHPSTLEVMSELGLVDELLKRPHQEVKEIGGYIGTEKVIVGDFTHLPVRHPFVAFMPQWDFLNFLSERAKQYPTFHLRVQSEVVANLEDEGRIVGVRAKTPQGTLEVRAPLTVGADGRGSIVRALAQLPIDDLGAPIDVLWMRISRRHDDPEQTLGYFHRGHILIMLNREEYWQCGFVIHKGGSEEIHQRGIEAFRESIAEIVPFTRDRLGELKSWDDIKLLTVRVDRLRQWYREGLLCIGDAAHAMSPVGGVGINLAIQDAVAAANLLAAPLRNDTVTTDDLRRVQRRREFPTRMMQRLQVFIQNRVIQRVLAGQAQPKVPLPIRLLRRFPILRRIPARVIGMGFRPEHVHTPDAFKSTEQMR
jgi:2-polyprenyl-6-methoxyphenol hydroxylase-like FAD-dependent oxidoreductase